MIFKRTSSVVKAELREKKFYRWYEEHKRWHQFFTILPRRISNYEVAWFAWITRRVDPDDHVRDAYKRGCRPLWEYGPLTNLLQPMENINETTGDDDPFSLPGMEENFQRLLDEAAKLPGGYVHPPKTE